MNSTSDRSGQSAFFTLPIILLGLVLGFDYGHAHEEKYFTFWFFSDLSAGIGTVLGMAVAIAIWYAVKPAQRLWLMLIILPVYTVIGVRMGYTFGKLLDLPIPGAVVCGMLGCVLGYLAGRAIAPKALS